MFIKIVLEVMFMFVRVQWIPRTFGNLYILRRPIPCSGFTEAPNDDDTFFERVIEEETEKKYFVSCVYQEVILSHLYLNTFSLSDDE